MADKKFLSWSYSTVQYSTVQYSTVQSQLKLAVCCSITTVYSPPRYTLGKE